LKKARRVLTGRGRRLFAEPELELHPAMAVNMLAFVPTIAPP
jgi:hypothetical protein